MNYQIAVEETWRLATPRGIHSNLWKVVRYAALAASSHNTQPWRFAQGAKRIEIRPDLVRAVYERRKIGAIEHLIFQSRRHARDEWLKQSTVSQS
jgi:nitroreductase